MVLLRVWSENWQESESGLRVRSGKDCHALKFSVPMAASAAQEYAPAAIRAKPSVMHSAIAARFCRWRASWDGR